MLANWKKGAPMLFKSKCFNQKKRFMFPISQKFPIKKNLVLIYTKEK